MSYILEEFSEKMGGSQLQVEGDEWVEVYSFGQQQPSLQGCCDCGLVHQFDYKVLDPQGRTIIFSEGFKLLARTQRDNEVTEKARGNKQFVCSINKGEK